MADETHPFGKWRPWRPREVAALFASLRVPWWISGGWAIDLFLGRQTRQHEDIDVQFLRRDQHAVRAVLGEWDVQAVLAPPRDETWPFRSWSLGEVLDEAIHDVWCRSAVTDLWALQLMIADAHAERWLFRRMPAIGRPIATIGGVTVEGIPYLAPEIQLLYKAKGRRPKNEADFQQALPALDQDRRQWLSNALTMAHPNHPWLKQLSES